MQSNNQTNVKTLTEEIYKQNLELLDQRRRVEQLIDSVSEGVFAVDENFNLTLLNNTLENMLGVQSDDVVGKPANEIIHLATEDNNPIKVENYCFTATNTNHLDTVVFKGNKKSYYVNIKSNIVSPTKDKQECLVTIVDITKEIELDKSKDEFISITSHELRTPMTIIKSYLWMLENGKGGDLNDKQEHYIKKAISGTERMLALINDMLNVSRIEQGRVDLKIEKQDLLTEIKSIEEDLKFKAESQGLEFKTNYDEDIQFAYFDKNKLDEILTNLIGNSLKFTKEGNITLAVVKENEDFAKITITDTGKGIAEENISKLFQKFGRLENSYQKVAEAGGTGLGLYIVKQYIEHMGGEIGVFSEGEGKGSTFWFTLPLHKFGG